MRNTKFKGFSKDCNDWIFGSLVEKFDTSNMPHSYYEIYSKVNGWWIVEPESIGEYTGINDILENEIYENDIVKMKGGFYDGMIRPISFRNTKFVFGEDTPIYAYISNMMVVGNTFEKNSIYEN